MATAPLRAKAAVKAKFQKKLEAKLLKRYKSSIKKKQQKDLKKNFKTAKMAKKLISTFKLMNLKEFNIFQAQDKKIVSFYYWITKVRRALEQNTCSARVFKNFEKNDI